MSGRDATVVAAEPLDSADRRRISDVALDRTLFVEAGAGTGKTTQLVRRISNLVLERGVPLSSIAAITFTEAAATELRSRIRAHFEQRTTEATDLMELERCRTAPAESDRAAISTLHGFAGRLLGEFPIAAALPPRVHVLDEVASQLAAEDRWARFVDGLYDDPAHEALLVRAALLHIELEPRFLGDASMRDVVAHLEQNWDLLDAMLAHAPEPLAPIDFGPFDRAVARLPLVLGDCVDDDDKLYRRIVDVLLPEVAAAAALPEERKLRTLRDVEHWAKNIKGTGRAGNWTDITTARSIAGDVDRARQAVLQPVTDSVLRHLFVLVARFALDGALQRRASGGLQFHDLLVLARDMLHRRPDVRAALHERYRHLLLDEFQDTDPIQIDLAVSIATSVERGAASRWSEPAVDEGRLFFVGDPKQSIYRFRRADIALFLEARDRFGGGDGLARLTTNFRTVPSVLDWVNDYFGQVMADEVAEKQPAYERLHAHRRDHPDADHRPVLLGGPHADPHVRAPVLREREAADVASAVADVVTRPQRWLVFDERSGGWRHPTLADVTILLPTRTSLPFLREALDEAALPYRLATGTLVYDTQEVRDVLAVLRAVDDPGDELSLVAALRSPLYGCSDVDLYRHRRAGGTWDLRQHVPDALAADHPIRAALAHLRGLWEQRWWLTPSTMVDRVVQDRHAFLLAFGTPRYADVWRRLRFLADQARAFEEAGGGGLRAFVDWAELQGADGARVHEPLLPETDEDAVRIMTIHGAKGLEFPIAILSGMTTLPAGVRKGVSVLLREGDAPQIKIGKELRTVGHEPRADLELEMDGYEKQRLLYVAATRARDHLVISCHHKAGTRAGSSYGQQVWERSAAGALCRRLDLPPPADAEGLAGALDPEPDAAPDTGSGALHAVRVPGDPMAERQTWLAGRERLLAAARRPRVLSATAVAHAATAGPPDLPPLLEGASEGRASGADDDTEGMVAAIDAELSNSPAVAPRRRGRAGTAVGRAVHATLQLLDLRRPLDVAAQVRQQCAIESIPELDETVERLVWAALRSDAVRLAGAHPHTKEVFVAAPLGERTIEGYVDLLIETPDGLVVVDYKTDSVGTEDEVDAKLAAYELQGAAYAAALEVVTGQPVLACRFVFCRAGGVIERTVEHLPAAVERVRQAVDRAAP